MRRVPRRYAVRLQSLVLAAVVVTALGRVATYVPPPPAPTAAALWQGLLAARAARVELTVDLAVADRRALRTSASGVLETAAARSSLRVTSSGIGTGDVTYDEVRAGAFVYVRPADGRWYAFTARDAPDRPAGLLVVLAEGGALRRAGRVGRADVAGVATTRYTTSARGGALDVWVAADGLVRRLRFQQASSVVRMDLSEFLLADPVVVPGRVTRVSGLAEALRRGAA